jgi:hypothetical protein
MAATKPKAKPKPQPAQTLPSRALEHGARAFGARFVKPGFAHTPQLDLAFALGHGNAAMAPIELLPDLPLGKKVPTGAPGVHRNVAIARLRKSGDSAPGELDLEAHPAPLEPDETRKLVVRRMKFLGLDGLDVRAIEAMHGPSFTLDAFVEGLEGMPDTWWNNGGVGARMYPLYGLMLRALPDETKEARARLTALQTKKKGHGLLALDVMLRGRAGIVDSGYKYNPTFKSYGRSPGDENPSNVMDLCFCENEPEWVAAQFARLWKLFNYKVINHMNGPSPARLFFLGGEATLETELQVVPHYPGTRQALAFESYRDLASPRAVELMKALAGPKSKVKAQAEAWLTAHA